MSDTLTQGSEVTEPVTTPTAEELKAMVDGTGEVPADSAPDAVATSHTEFAANARAKIDAATATGNDAEAARLTTGSLDSLRDANAERAAKEQAARVEHLENLEAQDQVVAPARALDKPAAKPEGLVSKIRNLFKGGESKQSGGE